MSEPKIPFSLRLTVDEHTSLKEAAGTQSMANYARSQLFTGNTPARKKRGLRPIKDREALARVLGRLGVSNISQNLHELADSAKSGCLIVDAKILKELTDACADIKAMRHDIMIALGGKVEKPPPPLTVNFMEAAE